MTFANIYSAEIERLEADEAVGREGGLSDAAFFALRKTLHCTAIEWFKGLGNHERIVALGFALAIQRFR